MSVCAESFVRLLRSVYYVGGTETDTVGDTVTSRTAVMQEPKVGDDWHFGYIIYNGWQSHQICGCPVKCQMFQL